MTNGRMDLNFSPVPVNVVYLTFNKLGGGDGDWSAIEAGSTITLRHGSIRQEVALHFRQDAESFHSLLEINRATARRLKLRVPARYAVSYNERTREMTLAPSPLSRANAVLRGGGAAGAVSIGYELQAALGLPERARLAVRCRYGSKLRTLTVRTPANLFDRSFRLPAAVMRDFQIPEGAPLALVFDQSSQTLTLLRPAGPAFNRPRKQLSAKKAAKPRG